MDSNHRYPAPKAGAIAARRHPVQCAIIWIMDVRVNGIIVEKLKNYYPDRIRFLKEEDPYRLGGSLPVPYHCDALCFDNRQTG